MSLKDILQDLETATAPEAQKEPKMPPPRVARITDLWRNATGAKLTSMELCQKHLGEVRRGEALHVLSAGIWSMEEPIAHVIDLIGPSDLYFMTWAAAHRSVLRLAEAMRGGFIRTFRAIVDERQIVNHGGAEAIGVLRAACGPGNVGLLKCHAKVYVVLSVDPEGPGYSFVSSANLNKNNRAEGTVITESRPVAEFYRDWIEEALDGGAAERLEWQVDKLRAELEVVEDRRLILIRGISGSGKTTYARTHYRDAELLEADDYFEGPFGYRFNAAELHRAHRDCERRTAAAMEKGGAIVIANTAARVADLLPYVRLAAAYGYEVTVVRLECPVEIATARNVHGTSLDRAGAQEASMEPYEGEIVVSTEEP